MWEFYMPTDVFFGEKILEKKGSIIDILGKRALVVTGKSSSKKNGSLDDLRKLLNETGISYEIFDEVEENPSFDNVMKAVERYRNDSFDFVVGLGVEAPWISPRQWPYF